MSIGEGYFEQSEVIEKIETLWSKVFDDSNKVLHQHIRFGYDGVLLAKDPSLTERVLGLQLFSAVIDVLINSSKAGVELGYEQMRQLLNAKAQITTMEQLAAAIVAKNQADYDTAVAALDRQAVI